MFRIALILLMLYATSSWSNPLVGNWSFKVGSCIEVISFDTEGKMETRSNDEIIVRQYILKQYKGLNYKFKTVPISSNEMNSCAGHKTKLDELSDIDVFIIFSESHNEFYLARDVVHQNQTQLGPFIRVLDGR